MCAQRVPVASALLFAWSHPRSTPRPLQRLLFQNLRCPPRDVPAMTPTERASPPLSWAKSCLRLQNCCILQSTPRLCALGRLYPLYTTFWAGLPLSCIFAPSIAASCSCTLPTTATMRHRVRLSHMHSEYSSLLPPLPSNASPSRRWLATASLCCFWQPAAPRRKLR